MHVALDVAALPLMPWLVAQGRRVKRDTPRLPPAGGPTHGRIDSAGTPLRLLVIGESTAAGVGADHHEEALTGQTARALHAITGRAIEWHAFGLSGATVAHATRSLLNVLPAQPMDLIVLVFGVNDSIERTVPRRYADGLKSLVGAARSRIMSDTKTQIPVLVCGAPPMHRFPALPRPLSLYLGARARLLDRAVRTQLPPHALFVPMQVKAAPHLFARDGFHPSAAGYAVWGSELARIAHKTFLTKESS